MPFDQIDQIPFQTSKVFKNFASYKEVENKKPGPVLLGFLNLDFLEPPTVPDISVRMREKDTSLEEKTPYVGHVRETVRRARKDLEEGGMDSAFYGRVLLARHKHSKENDPEWTYQKNQAFIAAIVDCKQTVHIVSDIQRFEVGRVSIDELLILKDNGYTFKPNPLNPKQTIGEPPKEFQGPTILRNYFTGKDTDNPNTWQPDIEKMQLMQSSLLEIKTAVLRQRANLMPVVANQAVQKPDIQEPETKSSFRIK